MGKVLRHSEEDSLPIPSHEERKGERKGDRLLYLATQLLVRIPYLTMPRIPRGQVTGHAYHILNRGNGGVTVFHKDGDYAAFLDLLAIVSNHVKLPPL